MRRSWPSTASRIVALAGGLDLDHLVGVDLVDLAEVLVAAGFGGGEGLAIGVLGALQVFFAAGGDLLALFLEFGRDLDAAIGGECVSVSQRLRERGVEPLELDLAELGEPGAKQERKNSAEHGADAQAGHSAFNQHAQSGKQRYQQDGDPRFASSLHRLGNDQCFEEAQGLIHPREPAEELVAGVAELLIRLGGGRRRVGVEPEFLVLGGQEGQSIPDASQPGRRYPRRACSFRNSAGRPFSGSNRGLPRLRPWRSSIRSSRYRGRRRTRWRSCGWRRRTRPWPWPRLRWPR